MVVAKHIGQGGNSMFQIAAAIGYARKYGYEWAVDPRSGVGEPYSKIHEWFPNLPKHDLHGARYHEHNNEHCKQHGTHKDLCHFDYHDIPNLGPNVSLTGFFQSWKYFEHCKEEIREVFKLGYVPGYENYVSIHVRRGDYVNHPGSFPPIDCLYISKAISKLRATVIADKFLVFSDDTEWCKENIPHLYEEESFTSFEFSEGRSALHDLILMANCGHHIIANSTFSWWAAYLSNNPGGIVVSPSHKKGNWFGHNSGVKKDCVDLLPPEWAQIEFR